MSELAIPEGFELYDDSSESLAIPEGFELYDEQPQGQGMLSKAGGIASDVGDIAAEFSGGATRGPLQFYDFLVTTPYNILANKIGLAEAETAESMARRATGGVIAPEKGAFAGEGLATDIASLAGESASMGGLMSKGFKAGAAILPESTAKNVAQVLAGKSAQSEAALGAMSGAGAAAGGAAGESIGGETGRAVGSIAGSFGASMMAPKSLLAKEQWDIGEMVDETAKNLLKGDPKHIAKIADLDPKMIQAAEEAGLDSDMILGIASQNPYFKSIYGALSALPGKDLQKKWIESTEAMTDVVKKNIQIMGAAENPSEMSRLYRSHVAENIEDLYQRERVLSDASRNKIPPTDQIEPSNTMKLLENEVRNMGGESKLNSVHKGVLKEILPEVKEKKSGALMQWTQEKKNPTYHKINDVRQQIGAALHKNEDNPYRSLGKRMLGRLYASLKQDQLDFVGQKYPEMVDHLNAANLLTVERKAAEEASVAMMGKTLSKDLMPEMQKKTAALAKGDYTDMNKAMENIPKELRPKVMATAIGESMTGKGLGEEFFGKNPSAKWFDRVNKNKESREVIKKHLSPQAMKRFDNLGRLAKGFAKQSQFVVKTGASLEAVRDSGNAFEKMLPKLGGLAATKAFDKMGLPIVGKNIEQFLEGSFDRVAKADQLLSDPVFVRDILKAHKELITTGKIKTSARRTKALDNWSKGLDAGEKEIISSIGILPFLLTDQDKQEDNQ